MVADGEHDHIFKMVFFIEKALAKVYMNTKRFFLIYSIFYLSDNIVFKFESSLVITEYSPTATTDKPAKILTDVVK